jgi:hypothetical protein
MINEKVRFEAWLRMERKNVILRCKEHKYYRGVPFRKGEELHLHPHQCMRTGIPEGFEVIDSYEKWRSSHEM